MPARDAAAFEALKRLNEHGAEYWSARDLQPLLGYSQWRRFEMDRMNATELAANPFRMTQTRDKLARDRIATQQGAINTHETVGREVREAIRKIGGTLPEDIAPAEHIRQVEKRVKGATPKLALDERDGSGLLGGPTREER